MKLLKNTSMLFVSDNVVKESSFSEQITRNLENVFKNNASYPVLNTFHYERYKRIELKIPSI